MKRPSAADPERARWPALLYVLVVPVLCLGLLWAFISIIGLIGTMGEREQAVLRVQETQLSLYDRGHAPALFARLPRADVARLSLKLGDEEYERRGVTFSLSLLNLLASWLLCAGALGILRGQPAALPILRWACLVNVPFGLVSVGVMGVRLREVLTLLGPELSQALAAVTRRPPEAELAELWLEHRLMVNSLALLYAACALFLALTAAYLTRVMRTYSART